MREQGARHERKRRQNLFLAPLQKTEVRGRKRHFFEFFFFFFFFFFRILPPAASFFNPRSGSADGRFEAKENASLSVTTLSCLRPRFK